MSNSYLGSCGLCIAIYLLVASCLSAPLDGSLSERDASKADLEALLNDLKLLNGANSKGESISATENVEQSTKALPRKRNCGVNLANDCGSSETAYINGLKSVFGSKRRLESPRHFNRRQGVASSGNEAFLSLPNLSPANQIEDDIKEEVVTKLLLKLIINIKDRMDQSGRQTDDLCRELTGMPCGQH